MTNCTCGKENPERATLPFIVGNVAASADQPAIVLLTIEGVWLATKGYADGIQQEGFQPLKEIIDSFVQHLNITEREWQAMVGEDFRKTLDAFKVPPKEQQELIAIVESTEADIVQQSRSPRQ
jgi:hypothetical protein